MDKTIAINHLTHMYDNGSNKPVYALKDVNLVIPDTSYTAIVGHTGSGKSTLIQHINALLKPTSGEVSVGDFNITNKTTNKNLTNFRQNIGMVFQFPEKQLFEETVVKDIMFGPLNYGKTEDEAKQMALAAMQLVDLDENLAEKSPFDLSGGQKRRVAIAGVLAMEPKILILDEPTAGLDPRSHREIMDLVERLHNNQQMTIILVTHQMDDVVQYSDQVVVMDKGEIAKVGSPKEVFLDADWLISHQLTLPKSAEFAYQLKKQGFKLNGLPIELDQLADEVVQGGQSNE